MENMLDYLRWRGDLPISAAVPLCPIDLLIFAQIVHAPLENLQEEKGSLLSLREKVYPAPPAREENALIQGRYAIWKAMDQACRFGQVRLERFESRFVPAEETQFAAALFLWADTGIVAFRGTDATLIGWKEDFNMGLEAPVPAQTDAVRFLNGAAAVAKRLYVCGHSKGGNLAMYASALCDESAQEKIVSVTSFDGPGLSDAVLASPGWARIQGRLQTFIPESSIIGLLLGSTGKSTIVKSDSVSLMQHNPFFWHVLGPRFVEAEGTTLSSQLMNQALHGFLKDCPVEKRQVLIETVFNVLMVSGATRLKDVPRGIAAHMDDVMSLLQRIPEEDRKSLAQVLRILGASGSGSLRSLMENRPSLH